MVLRIALVLALACGCHQSLFDSHGGDDQTGDGNTGGGDGMIAATCPSPCLGDAGGDFDGTPGGKGAHWRYLDDHRDRTWAPMTAAANVFTGANPANKITSCAQNGSAEACGALPGALLFSTAGKTTPADPGIEYTADSNRTIEFQLGVHVPAGGLGQTVRLYRNSREDVLFTGTADPGATISHSITVDALAGDRFLVAMAPPANGQPDIGVQLFVVGANATFPTECQVAVSFGALAGLTVDNLCAGDFTAMLDSAGSPAPALGAGPFAEQGQAATIAQHNYYSAASALDRPGDVTVDLWIKHQMLVDAFTGGWAFSDLDLDAGGGIGMVIYDDSGTLKISTQTCTDPNALTFDTVDAAYPNDHLWHFVRAVHKKDGALQVCIDGALQGMKTTPGTLKSTWQPFIGKNVRWTPTDASFIGQVDDVRVLNTALQCN